MEARSVSWVRWVGLAGLWEDRGRKARESGQWNVVALIELCRMPRWPWAALVMVHMPKTMVLKYLDLRVT